MSVDPLDVGLEVARAAVLLVVLVVLVVAGQRARVTRRSPWRWGVAGVAALGVASLMDVGDEFAGLEQSALRDVESVVEQAFYTAGFVLVAAGFVGWLPYAHRLQAAEAALRDANAGLERAVEERTRALADSEALFRGVFENAADAAFLSDADGRFVLVNAQATASLGYSRDELMALRVDDVQRGFDEDQLKVVQADLDRGARVTLADRHVRKDGSTFPVEVHLARIDHGGRPCTLAVARDVTERRNAERSLRFQAQLLDAVGEAVIATDLEGKITYWNRAAERMYGWSAREAIGRSIMTTVPMGAEEEAAKIVELLTQGKTWSGEFEVRRRDGSTFFAHVTDAPVFDRAGALSGFVGVSADITDRRRAEVEHRRVQGRMQAIVDQATDAVSILDADGTVRFITPAVRGMLGYEPDEFLRLDAWSLVAPEDRDRVWEVFARALEAPGSAANAEYRMRHKDGTWRTLDSAGRNLLGTPGVDGVLVVTRDVTERRRIEEEWRRQQEVLARQERLSGLGTLVAGVAHEVNNPLTYIRGNIELALMDASSEDDPSESKASLGSALEGVDRIERLVKALRVVARQGTGERRAVDLNDVLREVEALVRVAVPHGVDVEFERAEGPVVVFASAAEVHQVVLNLARNAMEAVDADGGRIRIEVRATGSRAQLVVEDDGPGIPPDDLPKVFTPFYTTKPEGTGLGLPIVHSIVHEHGGEVRLEHPEGGGARFVVDLPLLQAPIGPPPAGRTP